MLQWFLQGGALPPLLMVCGLFFLFYLRGFPFRAPRRMLAALRTRPTAGGISPFRALMQALAGTLGVGNIVGVASAIRIGGAGAVFWMWVSALLAMILKYAEILLAVRHRRERRGGGFFGGAVYYIKDYFDTHRHARAGALVASIFAVLMILDALSMGCMIQTNAIGTSLAGVLNIPPALTGVILLLLTIPLLLRGTRGISTLTEYLVPIMTGGYILLSAVVLILRRDMLGPAVASIFQGAFTPLGMGGGMLGFLTSRALRIGTMRGLLSNEAGCGTAPTAHAEADAKSPAAQGVWGIFEVFVDTILLCTATALVILVGADPSLYGSDDVLLTIGAYSSVLGDWAGYFFAAAIFCFGYGTLLCWGGYGMENLRFLTNKRVPRLLYVAAVGLCIFRGAYPLQSDLVWQIADFAIAALTVINLALLYLARREILSETVTFIHPKNIFPCKKQKHP